MKLCTVLIMLAAACFSVSAQDLEKNGLHLEAAKSIFSMNAGFVSDGHGGRGYAGFIKSATFMDERPFYYGFGSLFGSFTTTGEAFFETGLLAGYYTILGDTGLDLDLFLDFLATGGRINQETMLYQAEAPALHLGVSLGFSASSDFDGAVSIAPVIRPYNLRTQTWDFSRSYINLSFALRFKSYALVEQHHWAESFGSENTGEENR